MLTFLMVLSTVAMLEQNGRATMMTLAEMPTSDSMDAILVILLLTVTFPFWAVASVFTGLLVYTGVWPESKWNRLFTYYNLWLLAAVTADEPKKVDDFYRGLAKLPKVWRTRGGKLGACLDFDMDLVDRARSAWGRVLAPEESSKAALNLSLMALREKA